MVRRSPPTHPAGHLFTGKPSMQAHWAFAEDSWHKIHRVRELPSGSDLLREYLQLMLRHHDEGWRLKEFRSYFAEFSCERNGEARRIEITTVDPRVQKVESPGYGATLGCGPRRT